MNILGISAFYHDSAACLVRDGEIVAAAQEERFSRIKHDAGFPRHAIDYCLGEAGLGGAAELDLVAFYEKPFLKFERLLSTYLACAPRGLPSFLRALPVWVKDKIWLKANLHGQLRYDGPIIFPEHHESHAASAFFPSPFDRAAILTVDGVGEWTTTSVGRAEGNKLELLAEMRFPHSLGLLYSAFTYYLGFRVNSGEYKVMGLAPYGEPKFRDLILSELVDLNADGSFRLNLRYFDFMTGLTMTNTAFDRLFGAVPRKPEAELAQLHLDIARSLQAVTEEVMLRMARHAFELTGEPHLCLAGGVALNCVANGRILREGPFEKIWIQPAAGDAGGALGAALLGWHRYHDKPRAAKHQTDSQRGSFLGPNYDAAAFLDREAVPHTVLSDNDVAPRVAQILEAGQIVGWFQGRMEFGPRALGNRSILADPRRSDMQGKLNLKIKFRESFRPFAPAVMEERANDCFDLTEPSPYMLLVAPVQETLRVNGESELASAILARLNQRRSALPAVTHVDYSARVQTVSAATNPRFYNLLEAFERRTGCPVLVNTSFNVRGEPPVCTPEDAYRCFLRTDMDYLVLGDFLIEKTAIAGEASRSGGLEPSAEKDGDFKSPFLEPESRPALRRFGLTIGVAFLLLSAFVNFRHRGAGRPLASLAVLLVLFATVAPRLLRFVHRPWMRVADFLGAISSRILLTIVFFLVITPIGWLQRLCGKRPLDFDFKNGEASYWHRRSGSAAPVEYENQF
ncbi:MAG: carbamoyltransferase [Verrucomicrobiota bacterium]